MPKGSPGVARKTLAQKIAERSEQVSESGCWIWMGKVQSRIDGSDGYGMVVEPLSHREAYAHRVSWEIVHGPIPTDREICHRCDVRLCVNPAHMFLGTRKDNLVDAAKKGRMLKKLSRADVLEMRRLRLQGMTLVALSARFGIRHSGVRWHTRALL